MALGAIPVVANAADVKEISSDVLTSTDGTEVKYSVGKLVPGKYTFNAKLTSKVYGVKVTIGGKEKTFDAGNPTGVKIDFELKKETDVELTLVSTDPGEAGAGFSAADAVVVLNFDLPAAKEEWADAIGLLKTKNIPAYDYDDDDEAADLKAADDLIKELNAIADTYENYVSQKLYLKAYPEGKLASVPQGKIDALAATIASHQNTQAYNNVNAAITAIKGEYNTAVAELKAKLINEAAYLLEKALKDLDDNINVKITEATQASYASYQAGTAVADEAANKAKIPAEGAIATIVTNWTGQATANQNAYDALHAKVTGFQTRLNNVKPQSEAIAEVYPKTEAEAAVNALNTKIENAKNSAAQLDLDVTKEEAAAETKVSTLEGKVAKANTEFDANKATTQAIAGVQKKLDDANTAVNAKVSKDGQYKAQDYYAKYVEDTQKDINQLTTDAAKAYKVDGTGTAKDYFEGLAPKITAIEALITPYQTNAIAAVAKYDALQDAINGTDEQTGYQDSLDIARAQVANLPIYTDPNYDYQTKFDLIQKRINDIKKAITAAEGKVGAEHWTAMLDIDADAAINEDIDKLLKKVQQDQNQYDLDYLNNGLTDISTRIAALNEKANKATLGADYEVFAAAEGAINTKYTQIKTEKEAVDPTDPKADETIQALGARITALQAEQTALEAAAGAVEAKVAANTKAQTDLAKSIGDNNANPKTGMWKKIDTFKTTYKIGQDDSTLGNRGKAGGAITTEVGEIETDLAALQTANGEFDPTIVTIVDLKDKAGEWTTSGKVMSQTISDLENGLYDVQIDVTEPGTGAKVAVNGVEQDIAAAGLFTFEGVMVSDGKLAINVTKAKGDVEKLDFHENDRLAFYNNEDPEDADKDGMQVKYNKLAAQEGVLEKAAPDIKAAVKANADANTAATGAVADLQDTELATLKSLKNVTDATAASTDAVAKKEAPAGYEFKVFETGLAAGKSYTEKKAAIDADILAMSNAIAASNAAETLATDWKDNSITVGEGKNKKTYSIATLTQAINDLKAEAGTESDNWEAYKALVDNNWAKLQPDTISVSAEIMGAGAVDYYQGLKDSYITGKATILTNMQKDLKARKAVSTKDAFVGEINALIAKIKVVKSDGIANKKKYDEQKKAYQDTQTLWNSTYTEIAATDHSTKVQEWLDELDAIQVTLTEATNAVESNYKIGKSVAEAKDFVAIQNAINDVKARQSEAYNAQIAEDNKAAHESFMGNDTEKGAIQLATEAYQRAVQERAKYSSTNEEIKAVVDAAAATLDAALFSCPDDIAILTQQENEAYAKVVSPEVFDVSPYITRANNIKSNINTELTNFKNTVKGALQEYWNEEYPVYAGKLAGAKADINDYGKAAKKDAFKDVEDLIADGNAAVEAIDLAGIEAAITALEDIDDMLAADKDAAAVNDITAAVTAANKAYSDTKAYIEGKTIADDVNNVKETQLQNLKTAKEAADGILEEYPEETWAFDTHDDIEPTLANVVTVAEAAKTAVDEAIENDVANTEAYNEMIEAIAPVEAKLAEAKDAAAPYKYAADFANDENSLDWLKEWAEDAKANGSAVADKEDLINYATNLSAYIEATLTTAFYNEKNGLSADITELKNQFNTYVANHGLDEKANAFKKDIDDLEDARVAIDIKDLDDPEDGIQYDEILDATAKLIELQVAIADKESELLKANGDDANANVRTDFNNQIAELENTASLEGYAEWVAVQPLDPWQPDGPTLGEAITDLKAQLADVKAAIAAEENIAFYKDQYQAQLDAIKAKLDPVAEAIVEKQAQFDANEAAYATLTAEIDELQGKINAAKEKVGAYEYAANTYIGIIEQYTDPEDPTKLTGGAQYLLNYAKSLIDDLYGEKFLDDESEVQNKEVIENRIQRYLDNSAHSELDCQRGNLYGLLTEAIYDKYQEQTYSSVLWGRLVDVEEDITAEINALEYPIWNSYQIWESKGASDPDDMYGWVLDDNDQRIAKDRTSDADYADQIAEINRIKEEINDLSDAVDNLKLLGDANEDNRVNVLDYQKVINMILDPSLQPDPDSDELTPGNQTEAELFANIDINQSKVIEVGDLTAIVNYILNETWEKGYAAAPSLFPTEDNESLSMTQDTKRIAVNLQNANSYTAFQMDLVLPDGMKIVGTSLSNRAGESHKLYSRTQMDGSIRLLASSVKGETFSGNEGAVLYIDVETTSEYMGGNAELLNILFSDTNAQTRSFAIGGDATGINTLSTFETLKQKVYDLSGRLKDGVKKGLNIIRNADGSTKKVVK